MYPFIWKVILFSFTCSIILRQNRVSSDRFGKQSFRPSQQSHPLAKSGLRPKRRIAALSWLAALSMEFLWIYRYRYVLSAHRRQSLIILMSALFQYHPRECFSPRNYTEDVPYTYTLTSLSALWTVQYPTTICQGNLLKLLYSCDSGFILYHRRFIACNFILNFEFPIYRGDLRFY